MTNKYIDTKCIVCSQIFKEGDDIVVCPDCGTPYHRHCWHDAERCVNTELHERGFSWQPVYENAASHTPPPEVARRCMRCGTENDNGELFCRQCGMPLMQNAFGERPFNGDMSDPNSDAFKNSMNGGTNAFNQYTPPPNINDPRFGDQPNGGYGFGMPVKQIKLTEESDIDGIKLGDLFEYTGRGSLSMLASFVKFAKTGMKASLNLGALVFPEYYFFYRKMNKTGILFLLITFLLTIPRLIYIGQTGELGMVLFNSAVNIKSASFMNVMNICAVLNTVISVFAGSYANYWYYNKARGDIFKIRSEDALLENEIKTRIRKTGGTSWAGVVIAGTISVFLTLAFLLVMSALF